MQPELWLYKTANFLNQVEPYAFVVIHAGIILGFLLLGMDNVRTSNLFAFVIVSTIFWMLFWDDLQVYTERMRNRKVNQTSQQSIPPAAGLSG
jgi:hypothetical protein